MDEVLAAEELRKRYGDVVALDGVSLSVSAGEVFALIGPNGAGKTTLVRAFTGTTVPSSGQATLFGAEPRTVARSRLGLLPQDFNPPARLTGRELVRYYAGLYDHSQAVGAVLESVGMRDDADTWYETLSGGQQRRIAVGTALVNDPDVLFLDEPTTGIDPAGRRRIWALLEELAATGTTIFLTTHDMEEATALADRVGILVDGRIVEAGRPADLIRRHGGESRLVVDADEPVRGDAVAGTEHTVAIDNREIVFHAIEPTDIGDAVDALERAGITYEELTWRQPSLEDVYLSVTGKSYDPRQQHAARAESDSIGTTGGAR